LRVRIIGCYGGSAPGKRPTSFLIDDEIAIDTGALTSVLPIAAQALISHVFISHSHIDHLTTLPFLVDNVFPLVRKPIGLFGPEETIRCLKDHLFNGKLWPDFTRLNNGKTIAIAMKPLLPGKTVEAGGLDITPFAMDHTVPCHGHLIQGPDSAFAVCGDTCSIEGIEKILSGARNIKAVFLEASFPAREASVAALSKHLSTASFAVEAARIPRETAIFVYHMKPEFAEEIRGEIAALGMANVGILEQDEEYVF